MEKVRLVSREGERGQKEGLKMKRKDKLYKVRNKRIVESLKILKTPNYYQ